MSWDQPRSRFGRFIPYAHSESDVSLAPAYSLDLIRSRALLVDVLTALEVQREALTVVGAHTVLERTKELEPFLRSDATRDADLWVTPGLLVETPLLSETLAGLG